MYSFLNIFFFIFHSALMVFIIFGWMWRKTRVANLVVVLLTVFSWFILGIWYGFGFCPSTEWHWQVRMKLGYYDLPNSYTKFLVDSLTGLDVSQKLVDVLAVLFLTLALFASIFTNVLGKRKRFFHWEKFKKFISVWLNILFSEKAKHERRIKKITDYEKKR